MAGYEVQWGERTRLVGEPVVQLDGLEEREHEVQVRSIDPFGRRSTPVRVTGMPSRAARPALEYTDEFDTTDSVHAEVPGSRWHVSGYRGCIDLGAGRGVKQGQLAVQFGCGADDVVLRSRPAFRLISGNGRLTVVTDAAGPRGELDFDFVPGTSDRIGTRGDAAPELPPGAIRVSISDGGTRLVTTGGEVTPSTARPARRGSGALHKFDVVFTPSGVQVLQDDSIVLTSGVVPSWTTSTVLLGMIGPPGRRSRVHLDTVGMSSVVQPAEQVVEFATALGTQRVLRPQETAPGIGVTRQPLIGAAKARLRATVTLGAGTDPNGMSLQIADRTVPMVPATPGSPAKPGADVTLVAQLPPELFTGDTPALSPLVIRGQGTGAVLESYLEIVGTGPAKRLPDPELSPRLPALPTVTASLRDVNGTDLGKTASANAPFQLEINLDHTLTQRDADDVLPVRGFEVFLNERRIAAIPTDSQGPTIGGTYRLTVSATEELPGDQTLAVRLHPADRQKQPQWTQFTIALLLR
ncbi:hypothetical protein [Kibdelosporangium phytohabitans]|uniref:Uncharacterized protein n=1 Tax=Kibdelosporangium phytohabitans TaxID=860235 RepID=A0A0N9IC31_9PSEU|nr:hypothetical protein [Kibdelosporangium phytohabitans]ALG12473.1 hypothetical protein AOZ06_41430 [Kibdelosporangium phytohabitans]MBE1464066.1 hypothetical protein [Kibdelosporangium phytohabitans]